MSAFRALVCFRHALSTAMLGWKTWHHGDIHNPRDLKKCPCVETPRACVARECWHRHPNTRRRQTPFRVVKPIFSILTTLLFCLGPTYSPSPSRAVSFMFSVLWEYFVPWSYVVVPLLVAIVTFAPLCCWCR